MLSLRRGLSVRGLGAVTARRGFCAPVVPLAEQVKGDLATMKEQVEQKAQTGYTPEAFQAAVDAGTVDTSLLSQTMDFSDDARKVPWAVPLSRLASLPRPTFCAPASTHPPPPLKRLSAKCPLPCMARRSS